MWQKTSVSRHRGGGYSHVKAYRDVLPKWVTFSPMSSLDVGPILVKKILIDGSHFTKIAKSAILEEEKTL